ncbi:MAG: Phosphopantetheine adenylyltransferase [Chlamydiae bacterium]|nr:Phosphopantetheine adenylyltransferase [Chlamydiota bacterium]
MSIGLYPGTFDPPTFGHLDVIERAATMCDKLLVGVAQNSSKKNICFSTDERAAFLKALLAKHKNIEIVHVPGLVVDFAKKMKISFLIRGLRAFSDMEHEFQMALANKKIGEMETIFFMADGKYAHISSTLIREIARAGHHLKDFIPPEIEPQVTPRLHQYLRKS